MFSLKGKLEQQDIKTIGGLCKRTPEEILQIQAITEDDVLIIQNALAKWMEERNIIKVAI